MGSERTKNPTLFGIGTQHRDESLEVIPPMFSIGRSQECTLTIQHIAISRLHCSFKYDGAVWSLTDQSTCGTYINGKRIQKGFAVPLDEGSVVKLGPHPHFIYIFSFREREDLEPVLSRLALKDDDKSKKILVTGYSSSSESETEGGGAGRKRRWPPDAGLIHEMVGGTYGQPMPVSSKRHEALYYPEVQGTNVGVQPHVGPSVYYSQIPNSMPVGNHGGGMLHSSYNDVYSLPHPMFSSSSNPAVYSMHNTNANFSGGTNPYVERPCTNSHHNHDIYRHERFSSPQASHFRHDRPENIGLLRRREHSQRRETYPRRDTPNKRETTSRKDYPNTRMAHVRISEAMLSPKIESVQGHRHDSVNGCKPYNVEDLSNRRDMPSSRETLPRKDFTNTRMAHVRIPETMLSPNIESVQGHRHDFVNGYKPYNIEDLSNRHAGMHYSDMVQKEKHHWRPDQNQSVFPQVEEKENLIEMSEKPEDVKRIVEELSRVKSDLSRREEVEKKLQAALENTQVMQNQLQSEVEMKEGKLKNLEDDLIEMTAAKNKADETLKSHEQKLAKISLLVENELQCSICNEIFIRAVTLGCKHTFCGVCIQEWKTKKMDCPMCRTPIGEQTRSIALDSFIEKMVEFLSDDVKEHRKNIVTQRDATDVEVFAAEVEVLAVEGPPVEVPANQLFNPVNAANEPEGPIIYISSDSEDNDDNDNIRMQGLQDLSSDDSDSSGAEDFDMEAINMFLPRCDICGDPDHTTANCPF